jgi:Tfp pilus assembly protein PilP
MKTGLLVLVFALLPAAAPAQAPAQASIQPTTQGSAASPAPVETFSYQRDGRRDPFLNLLAAGLEPALPANRPDGAAGLATEEISVRGIMSSRGALVAMIQGPDNRTHIVRQGDRLLDGTVKAVTSEGLIIAQDVNDPLSLVKQREVRRLLRSIEDAKQ